MDIQRFRILIFNPERKVVLLEADQRHSREKRAVMPLMEGATKGKEGTANVGNTVVDLGDGCLFFVFILDNFTVFIHGHKTMI